MHLERIFIIFAIAMGVFAIGQAGSAAIGTRRPEPTPRVERVLDAKALLKKLETLDTRLHEAQTSIDEVLAKLATVDDSQVDITRTRLNVLFRLESGLVADIARTKQQLAAVDGK